MRSAEAMAALRASAACERQHLTVSAAYAHQLEDKQHRLLDCRRQLTPVDSVKERERAMKCKMMIRRRSRRRPGEKQASMNGFLRWSLTTAAHFIHGELIVKRLLPMHFAKHVRYATRGGAATQGEETDHCVDIMRNHCSKIATIFGLEVATPPAAKCLTEGAREAEDTLECVLAAALAPLAKRRLPLSFPGLPRRAQVPQTHAALRRCGARSS